jgi:hypothetical protein
LCSECFIIHGTVVIGDTVDISLAVGSGHPKFWLGSKLKHWYAGVAVAAGKNEKMRHNVLPNDLGHVLPVRTHERSGLRTIATSLLLLKFNFRHLKSKKIRLKIERDEAAVTTSEKHYQQTT